MPRLLDLFCCEGGAAAGYAAAGWDVIGVDIEPRPRYPYPFIQADALHPPVDWSQFDAVHASPPCPRYSVMTPAAERDNHPDLAGPVVAMLHDVGLPWIVENVPGAPIDPTVVLCGSMFGLRVRRHRWFQSSHLLYPPGPCRHREQGTPIGVYGDGGGTNRPRPDGTSRGVKAGLAEARLAMGMPWGSRYGVSQSIPPAYTEWLGAQLLDAL